nr:immunoglobulin heavy chain junction region [Macaca mulatta]MOV53318.1 immunoglobulin heavy chain junction region [Macaca mulatta]MOV53461.1 immunoglobulin heavy chain junction region [Macaca mulatta]MOV53512.1 immunoglobulin heavy chain junction region [Macaca mulatta]MOV53534.1 immunoglobulin heavy chain junction region [Macaca mulatta]
CTRGRDCSGAVCYAGWADYDYYGLDSW